MRIEIPDVMENCKRYRKRYRGENIYITVCGEGQTPLEVFVEWPTHGESKNWLTVAGWDGFTRTLSHLLQMEGVVLDEVIKQLRKASIQEFDLPGVLASVLENWVEVGYEE